MCILILTVSAFDFVKVVHVELSDERGVVGVSEILR